MGKIEQSILRGKKWADTRAKAVFQNNQKEIDWLDSQSAIVDDIKVYEDSITSVEEKPKFKGRK